jgi:phytoene/squalene synthetase
VDRTRRLFDAGAPLIGMTRGRLRAELAATLQGGRSILDAISRLGFDTLHHRPVLGVPDRISILWHGLTGSRK